MKYEEAVRTLNVLQNGGRAGPKTRDEGCLVVMQEFLDRVSINQEDLKKLNIVHISGTKGKGSTCAFVESILRHHGYKTGFFSSPHLVEVRERFRINGKPISKIMFSEYFEDVYRRFSDSAAEHCNSYPTYFYFLTVMAYYLFLSQRVDVAIMEVGIGGAFDCTNVGQHTTVCGVTPLGYDHTHILGQTIDSIAWHKAGIFKPGASAFTAPQPHSALQVLSQSAFDAEIMLQICPDLSQYGLESGKEIKLGLAGEHQRVNASLALQIAESWMRKKREQKEESESYICRSEVEAFPSLAPPFLLTQEHLTGLAECSWHGRAQVMNFNDLTFYFDGAHTVRSMRWCAKWFQEESQKEEKHLGTGCTRILVFNVTHNRDAAAMFRELQDCDISRAVFTPNIATFVPTDFADQTNIMTSVKSQLLVAVHNHEEWIQVKQEQKRQYLQTQKMQAAGGFTQLHDYDVCEVSPDAKAPVFPTIADAVVWLAKDRDESLLSKCVNLASAEKSHVPQVDRAKHIQVLVTGSVHLVGGFLRILDPNMND